MKKMLLLISMFLLVSCGKTENIPLSNENNITEINTIDQDKQISSEEIADEPLLNEEEVLPENYDEESGTSSFNIREQTEYNTYKINEGLDTEIEVIELDSSVDGPTIYIVGGTHGNETAGWVTANRLKEIEIVSGKLYILSPANVLGVRYGKRYVTGEEDLNRSYPGKVDGSKSEVLAYSIFSDIKEKNPVFVLDLHEARKWADKNRDNLGESLIYTKLDGMEDLFFGLLEGTENRKITSQAFTFFGPGPKGSLNETVSNILNIPIITVETYRGQLLERRVADQLSICYYVLKNYGVVE